MFIPFNMLVPEWELISISTLLLQEEEETWVILVGGGSPGNGQSQRK